jgi:PhzF family phenazine biosynthesis protein
VSKSQLIYTIILKDFQYFQKTIDIRDIYEEKVVPAEGTIKQCLIVRRKPLTLNEIYNDVDKYSNLEYNFNYKKQEAMDTKTFKQLARSLVDFFYPLVEASLFTHEGEIIEILNPFSSHKEDQTAGLEVLKKGGTSHEVLISGDRIKQMIHPIYDGGFLRLRYDTSKLHHLKDQLELLLEHPLAMSENVNEWQTNVDQLIAQYLKAHQTTMQAATIKQKREMIAQLNSKKLFEFKEASAYIATKMQISRATIYNYLKTISSFEQVQIHQVDAFTDKKFGGNPAGVVLDAEQLDESLMRKITRELNLSETSFVLPSKRADFRLRYFTPTGHEISFCGHSTVGALFVIAHEKRYQIDCPGIYDFNVETLSGTLKMQTIIDQDEKIRVTYEPPKAKLRQPKISHEMVAKAAGIRIDLIDQTIPITYDATSKTLFIAMKSLDGLKQMQCNFKSMASFSKDHDLIVLCFLTRETFNPKNQIHMRCFAPLVGINEDPFTGSVLGGLTVYADQFHLLPPKSDSFKVEQGHFLERPGLVEVKFSKLKDVYHIIVCAQAVHCFSTEINLT